MPEDQVDFFVKMEYEQLHNTFRTSILTLTNVLSALVVANMTVIGYALTTQKAGIFLVGVIICLAALIILLMYRRYMVPFAYRAVYIETEYIRTPDAAISLFLNFFFAPRFVQQLREIAKIQDHRERFLRLQHLRPLAPGQRWSTWLIMISILLQLLCVPILIYCMNWRLF